MKQKKTGKKAEEDNFKKYGVFSDEKLHSVTGIYRDIVLEASRETGDYSRLKQLDDCWDRWRKDHGN